MSWAYVQGAGNHGTSASDTPITVTLGSSTPVGRLIVVGIANYNGVVSGVADSASNSYSQIIGDLPTQIGAEIWSTVTTHAGTLTVTVSGGGLNYTAVAVDEFSSTGAITTDGKSSGDGTNTTPITGGVATTTSDIVYGLVSMGNVEGSHTAGSGYTLTYSLTSASNVNLGLAAEYKLNVTGAGVTPGFTLGSAPTGSWTMVAAAWQAGADPVVSKAAILLPAM